MVCEKRALRVVGNAGPHCELRARCQQSFAAIAIRVAQYRVRDGARVAKGRDPPAANRHRCELHLQRARHAVQRALQMIIERPQLRIR